MNFAIASIVLCVTYAICIHACMSFLAYGDFYAHKKEKLKSLFPTCAVPLLNGYHQRQSEIQTDLTTETKNGIVSIKYGGVNPLCETKTTLCRKRTEAISLFITSARRRLNTETGLRRWVWLRGLIFKARTDGRANSVVRVTGCKQAKIWWKRFSYFRTAPFSATPCTYIVTFAVYSQCTQRFIYW